MASPPSSIVSLGYDIGILEYIDHEALHWVMLAFFLSFVFFLRLQGWMLSLHGPNAVRRALVIFQIFVSNCIYSFTIKNFHIPFIVHNGIHVWISNVHFLKTNNQTIHTTFSFPHNFLSLYSILWTWSTNLQIFIPMNGLFVMWLLLLEIQLAHFVYEFHRTQIWE
jgi:hypothetical protein